MSKERQTISAKYSQRQALQSMGLFLLYVVLAKLSMQVLASDLAIDFLWLTTAVALTSVFLGGYQFLPSVFLGALVGGWVVGESLSSFFVDAACHAVAVFLGVWLLKRGNRFDQKLHRLSDFGQIFLLALGIGFLTASATEIQVWLFSNTDKLHNFNQNLSGQLLGIVLIMPFLLVWQSTPYGWPSFPKGFEAGAIILLSFLVGQVVFLDWFHDTLGQVARGYWMYLLITWAATRLGLHGTVSILLITAIQGLLGALVHEGFFANDIEQTHLANYFFYMLILATVGMALATYLIERALSLSELKQHRDQLEQLVDSRTEDLARQLNEMVELNDRLKAAQNQLLQSEKMASLGQLAAGVAHEINNPVGYINSNLGTLEKYIKDIFQVLDAYEATMKRCAPAEDLLKIGELKKELDFEYVESDISELLRESKNGMERVKKIVMDLKGFSHVGQNVFEMGDIHECIDATLNVVWHELKYKCKISKQYDPALPKINCVPSQLSQVFMNLLVNSAQAIETNGEITITTQYLASDHVIVMIQDTGTGISPENLAHIFDPFFTTKPVGKGTGLGLSLAYGIVKNHHGVIEAKSVVGKGTLFTLTLPVTF